MYVHLCSSVIHCLCMCVFVCVLNCMYISCLYLSTCFSWMLDLLWKCAPLLTLSSPLLTQSLTHSPPSLLLSHLQTILLSLQATLVKESRYVYIVYIWFWLWVCACSLFLQEFISAILIAYTKSCPDNVCKLLECIASSALLVACRYGTHWQLFHSWFII